MALAATNTRLAALEASVLVDRMLRSDLRNPLSVRADLEKVRCILDVDPTFDSAPDALEWAKDALDADEYRQTLALRHEEKVARSKEAKRAGPGMSALIRAWAKEQGYTVAKDGRISAAIVAEYEAAHGIS